MNKSTACNISSKIGVFFINMSKNPEWLWEITLRFLRRERRTSAKILVSQYTLQNYSYFRSKISFNNGSILEVHDYLRTKKNASLYYRLREKWRKCLYTACKDKVTKLVMSDFLISPICEKWSQGSGQMAS